MYTSIKVSARNACLGSSHQVMDTMTDYPRSGLKPDGHALSRIAGVHKFKILMLSSDTQGFEGAEAFWAVRQPLTHSCSILTLSRVHIVNPGHIMSVLAHWLSGMRKSWPPPVFNAMQALAAGTELVLIS